MAFGKTKEQTENKDMNTPSSSYEEKMKAYFPKQVSVAKILAANLPQLNGGHGAFVDWDRAGDIEKKPFFDVAEKVLVCLGVSKPEKSKK